MPASREFAVGAAVLLLIGASPACRSGSEISNRLEEIMAGVTDRGGGRDPDAIREALAHQLREAPVPAHGANRPSNPAFPTRQTLADFYARRDQRLAWCTT